MLRKKLNIKIQMWHFMQQALNTDKVKLTGWKKSGVEVGVFWKEYNHLTANGGNSFQISIL
jgi:hypothetical protein